MPDFVIALIRELRWNHQTAEQTQRLLDVIKRVCKAALPRKPTAETSARAPPSHGHSRSSSPSDAEEEEKEETFHAEQLLAPLLPEKVELVTTQWQGSDDDTVRDRFGISISRSVFRRLRPTGWLTDNVIDFFFKLLERRFTMTEPGTKMLFFNTWFIYYLLRHRGGFSHEAVRSYTRDVDLFECKQVYIPINVTNTHWTLAVIGVETKTIQYFDSLGGSGDVYLQALQRYVTEEYAHKHRGSQLDWGGWRLNLGSNRTPQQENGSDCGVFVLCTVYLMAHGLMPAFSQADIPAFRCRVAYSILEGHVFTGV